MQAWQQDILQSMGLSLLQPRCEFPAAAAEVQLWQMPQKVAANHIKTPTSDLPAQASQAATQVDQAVNVDAPSALAMLQGMHADEQATMPESKPQATTALRFRLRLVRYDQLLMLIDQPSLHWAEEQQSHAFFNDIYFALFACLPTTVESQVFEWPPSKHYPHAQDKQQAQQTFISFMQNMLSTVERPLVLSWGKATDYILSQPLVVGEYYSQTPLNLLRLHDVNHYWRQADSKRQLWQQLQVIRPLH